MKNNKGFTMVELLAVIVLLGVLGTIGVTVTYKYLTQSREKSYRILSQTIYEAYENCAIQGKCSLPPAGDQIEYNIDNLLNDGYLENLKSPYNNNKNCTGSIIISANDTNLSKDYTKYTYRVRLDCPGIKNAPIYTWPDEKEN